MKSLHYKTQRGFTLVEMMVSISIFAIVAVVAIGALLKIVDANKKAQSLETSINNLNFALDSITREMRVGTNYKCFPGASVTDFSDSVVPIGCTNAATWTIVFDSSEKSSKLVNGISTPCSKRYAYRYDSNTNTLKKAQQATCDDGNPTFYSIIADSSNPGVDAKIYFDLANLSVIVGSNIQSYAQFHFKGTAGTKAKNKSAFDLQTTVSQRLPD